MTQVDVALSCLRVFFFRLLSVTSHYETGVIIPYIGKICIQFLLFLLYKVSYCIVILLHLWQRTAADHILRDLQNNPDMWLQVVHILSSTQSLNTKFFALQVCVIMIIAVFLVFNFYIFLTIIWRYQINGLLLSSFDRF